MGLKQTAAALCCISLLAAAPRVKTAGYFNNTTKVLPVVAAHWLTWAEVHVQDAPALSALGAKTLLYTDPNRTMAQGDDPDYVANDDSAFAHDCSGNRIFKVYDGRQQFLMQPDAPALVAHWRYHVNRYTSAAHFDAVFEDDANDVLYMPTQPCNLRASDWLQATIDMQSKLGFPVVYNGLDSFNGHGVSLTIGLNATALGGMMEQCYARAPSLGLSSGWRWQATEETERLMAAAGKLFFCYGNDTSPAEASVASRLYVYASFLMTYDLETSILWEYYATPSNFHVMPEIQLVPVQPKPAKIGSIDELRTATGVYQRAFERCYLAGVPQGPCVIAVNPDSAPHQFVGAGEYHRTLQLSGAGVADGGSARVVSMPPPRQLSPVSATIAFP